MVRPGSTVAPNQGSRNLGAQARRVPCTRPGFYGGTLKGKWLFYWTEATV